MTAIDRHPHSQAFHDKVTSLWDQYTNQKNWFDNMEIEDFFMYWNVVTGLCEEEKYLTITTHSILNIIAISAISILSRLPGNTIGVVELLDQMKTTHDKKQADYGNSAEPFANVLASHDLGIHPVLGILLRMNDKMTRIKSFQEKGNLANESVEDSLLDIAVYAIIAVVIIEEELDRGRN